MKLKVISEVFRQPSLDGINISGISNNYDYSFEINNIQYYIKIKDTYRSGLLDYIVDHIHDNDNDKSDKLEKIISGRVVAYITLEHKAANEQHYSYELTNAGNPFTVYNKLIACILHYIERSNPIGFEFAGFNYAQNLIYDKLFRYFSKLYPQHQYIRLSDKYYIKKEIADMIETLETDWGHKMGESESQLAVYRQLKKDLHNNFQSNTLSTQQ